MVRRPVIVRRSRLAGCRPRLWLIGAILLVLGFSVVGVRIARLFSADRLNFARQTVKLERVTDGDTLHLIDRGGRELKVRLAGVDTPELGTADGFRSALYLAELLEKAQRIYLEVEPKHPVDRYGRTLGWVFVVHEGNELLVQEELVRRGLAALYPDSQAEKYATRLRRALPR